MKEKIQGFSLRDKSAFVLGCGGLGCNIATHLAGSGIGKLYLCDFDTVSESNLNRQFLYTKSDIGKSKAITAKERLESYSEDTRIIAVNKKIAAKEDLSFVKNCDILISGVDNEKARIVLQSFAEEQNLPLVLGGIDGFYGIACLYIPKISPRLPSELWRENKSGFSVSSTAGIIGSLESAIAIKYLLTNDESISGKIIIYDEYTSDTLTLA